MTYWVFARAERLKFYSLSHSKPLHQHTLQYIFIYYVITHIKY